MRMKSPLHPNPNPDTISMRRCPSSLSEAYGSTTRPVMSRIVILWRSARYLARRTAFPCGTSAPPKHGHCSSHSQMPIPTTPVTTPIKRSFASLTMRKRPPLPSDASACCNAAHVACISAKIDSNGHWWLQRDVGLNVVGWLWCKSRWRPTC